MSKRSLHLIAILTLAVLTWAVSSAAGAPQPAPKKPSLDLLDRGAAPAAAVGPKVQTHTTPSLMTATLANVGGTPGVPAVPITAMVFAPGAPVGYFFPPGPGTMPVPGGFPTGYLPFFVTGAYGFIDTAGMLGLVAGGSPVLAAGVAPGPFTVGTGTWAGFATGMVPFVPGPGMVFGGKLIFPHSPPALSVPTTPTGLGVACGIDGFGIVGGGATLAGLGGLTPGTGGGKPLSVLMPPGTASGLGPITAAPGTYVVGCFIAGATVPVELQAYHVE